jgi:hypothetical protein
MIVNLFVCIVKCNNYADKTNNHFSVKCKNKKIKISKIHT